MNHFDFPLGGREETHSHDSSVIMATRLAPYITCCFVSEVVWPSRRQLAESFASFHCAQSEIWLKPAEPVTSPQAFYYKKGELCEVRKQNRARLTEAKAGRGMSQAKFRGGETHSKKQLGWAISSETAAGGKDTRWKLFFKSKELLYLPKT